MSAARFLDGDRQDVLMAAAVNNYLKENILYAACSSGDVNLVKHVISQNIVDINSKYGEYGRTPVMGAALGGHVAIFTLLVREGADVSAVDDQGNNILHLACTCVDEDMVKHILKLNIINIETRGNYGRTPVVIAAEKGNMGAFKLLMRKGASVSIVDANGGNILHAACGGGHLDVVKHILKLNIIGIESKGNYGATPAMCAAQKGHIGVFALLLKEGADVSIADNDGDNILHVACVGGHLHMIKHIISLNIVSIDTKGRNGSTPLMYAARKGNLILFKLLVREGADVSVVDNRGDTVLHIACVEGHLDMVKHITSPNIVSINSKGHSGRTPVICAAMIGHIDGFKLLVRKGADLSILDDDRCNILHLACLGGNLDMVKHIISRNIVSIDSKGHGGVTPVMYAAHTGNMVVFKLLVKKGADVSIVDDDGNNILHVASGLDGQLDMVKYIVSQNIFSIDSKGHHGRPAVMCAAEIGHMDVFKLLVREGADLSIVDDYGDNILHLACVGGHWDMVKHIISKNIVNIDSKGQYGRTPVISTAEKGQVAGFKLLVTEGADVSIVDDIGDNVLHVACLCGQLDMVTYIISQNIFSIDSKGQSGATLVMCAVNEGHMGVYKLLVKEGADLSLLDDNGHNVLHLACVCGQLDMVTYIISQNIFSIDSKGQSGATLVMCAAKEGHMDVYKLLAREGADLSLLDDNGRNVLHLACLCGQLEMVKHIVSQNIFSIDSKGQYGRSAVMCAAEIGHMDVFKLLVREGADLSIVDDYGDNVLHIACIGGHWDMVKHIISKNIVSIDSKGRHGRTPVLFAAEKGHVALFKLILSEEADVSIMDDNGCSILHSACVGGHLDIVKHIISQKIVSIDSKEQYGRTPVMTAARKGHIGLFNLLVRKGANVSVVDDYGTNILHVACLGGNLDMVKHIISKDIVSIDSRGNCGRTPVMYAAVKGHIGVFKLLVREGADVYIVDDNGSNILHISCLGGNVDMVKYVVSQNIVSVDSKGQNGSTPVVYAAQYGHIDVFKLLVSEWANVSVVDDISNNILHLACLGGNLNMVKHILSQNVFSVDSVGQYGMTSVMLAVKKEHKDVFTLLVSEGVDMSIVNDYGNNILHLACICGNVEMVKAIISLNVVGIDSEGKYRMTPVMKAAEKGHMEVFELLVSEGADVYVANDYGSNILHLACLGGNVDLVKQIVSRKVVSIESSDIYGRTAVVFAAMYGHIDVFKLLVTEGADLSIMDDDGDNILHLACFGGDVDIVKYIISESIVSVDTKGKYGMTPVMFAVAKGHTGVFKLLVTEGADVSIVDDDGDNILHLACVGGNVDMVKHIISENIVSKDSKGKYGMTPVMFAVARGQMGVFELLVTEGADLSVVVDDGDNILHLACVGGNVDIVKLIISQNIVGINSKGHHERTPVMYAAQKRQMAVLKTLVREGADVSIVDDNGNNSLHVACTMVNLDMVKHILSQNIVSIESKGQYGRTPVMFAVDEKGHIGVFKLLVREGADLSVVDDNTSNILHLACGGGNVDMVKHIISQNIVSIDSKGQYGRTPVMCAAEKGHVDVIKLLVTEGADMSVVDAHSDTIITLARQSGNMDKVQDIMSQGLL